MNLKLIEEVANAVLYEGYMLYPYRASAVKNRQRWNFGVVAPPGSADASSMQTECVILGRSSARLEVRLRFLQLVERSGSAQQQPWEEAVEREVTLSAQLGSGPLLDFFNFPAIDETAGPIVRKGKAIDGAIELETEEIRPNVFAARVRVLNLGSHQGTDRERTPLQSMVSTHAILNVVEGEFISMIDPPDELRDVVATCRNIGTWPVLVGEKAERDAMLSSPIILYDYPQIAPESPGALFDGTEIDEILTLRILTMTDAEKKEMRETDERARQLLERTESLPPEHMMKLHGVLRGVHPIHGEAE